MGITDNAPPCARNAVPSVGFPTHIHENQFEKLPSYLGRSRRRRMLGSKSSMRVAAISGPRKDGHFAGLS
jgi:hypothetical protein